MRKKITALLTAAVVALGISGSAALAGCGGTAGLVYTLSDDGTHYIVSASGSSLAEAEISEVYDGGDGELPVTEIASKGFFGCTKLTSIVIPDSITTIGSSAFAYCTHLTSVTLSNNLTTLSYGIFGNCSSLKNVEIPASVTKLAAGAFIYSCIETITVPETVQSIGAYCFYECEKLESADIRCEITTLPYGTFYSCTSLTSVTLPASITEIKGEEEVETTGDDGETTTATYYAAFAYSVVSAGSQYISYDYELEYVHFRGTEEQWDAVIIGENNYGLTDDTQIVCNYAD